MKHLHRKPVLIALVVLATVSITGWLIFHFSRRSIADIPVSSEEVEWLTNLALKHQPHYSKTLSIFNRIRTTKSIGIHAIGGSITTAKLWDTLVTKFESAGYDVLFRNGAAAAISPSYLAKCLTTHLDTATGSSPSRPNIILVDQAANEFLQVDKVGHGTRTDAETIFTRLTREYPDSLIIITLFGYTRHAPAHLHWAQLGYRYDFLVFDLIAPLEYLVQYKQVDPDEIWPDGVHLTPEARVVASRHLFNGLKRLIDSAPAVVDHGRHDHAIHATSASSTNNNDDDNNNAWRFFQQPSMRETIEALHALDQQADDAFSGSFSYTCLTTRESVVDQTYSLNENVVRHNGGFEWQCNDGVAQGMKCMWYSNTPGARLSVTINSTHGHVYLGLVRSFERYSPVKAWIDDDYDKAVEIEPFWTFRLNTMVEFAVVDSTTAPPALTPGPHTLHVELLNKASQSESERESACAIGAVIYN